MAYPQLLSAPNNFCKIDSMRKGRDGEMKRKKKKIIEIEATNVIASRPPNGADCITAARAN